MQSVIDREVRRGHVVVAHRHKNFKVRISRQGGAQRYAGVDVAVVCVPVPRARDAAPQNVVLKVALVTEFGTNVVVEGGCVGRTNGGFARVKVRTVRGKACIETLESSVKPAKRSSF